MPSQFDAKTRARILTLIIVILAFAAFFSGLKTRHWSDSEIWGVRQSAACADDWSGYACAWKPLFHVWVGGPVRLFSDRSLASDMNVARFLVIPFWLGIAWIWFLSQPTLLFFLCFLGSSCFFMDASVARSDFFALPFVLLHATILMNRRPPSPESEKQDHQLALLGLTGLLAVLLTPKSVIALLALCPLYVARFRHFRWRHVALMTASAAILTVIALDVFGTGRFFLNLFENENYGMPYFSWQRFHFFLRAMSENPHLPALALVWVISIARSIKKHEPLSAGDLAALLVIVGTWLFPDKLPFFVASQTVLFLFLIAPRLDSQAWTRRISSGLALFAIVNGLYWAFQLHQWTNSRQATLAKAIDDALVDLPTARVFDGLGVHRSDELPSLYFGPGDAQMNSATFDAVVARKFDVLAISSKVDMFVSRFRGELERNYIETIPDVYVRSIEITLHDPAHPGREVNQAVWNEVRPDLLTRKTPFAILYRNPATQSAETLGNRTYTLSDLNDNLPPICRPDSSDTTDPEAPNAANSLDSRDARDIGDIGDCKPVTVRLTPFGKLVTSQVQISFFDEFRFEPASARLPFWQALSNWFASRQ